MKHLDNPFMDYRLVDGILYWHEFDAVDFIEPGYDFEDFVSAAQALVIHHLEGKGYEHLGELYGDDYFGMGKKDYNLLMKALKRSWNDRFENAKEYD